MLAIDMGLGKSVITLTAVTKLLQHNDVTKVLVVAPLRVAKFTWEEEIRKWDHTAYLKLAKILGSEKQRTTALNTSAHIYVINRENLEWLVRYYGSKWPFDMVILDESSSFKDHTSKRFRAMRRVRPLIKRIVELTGTPAPNSLLDLWAQVYLLDSGERLGRTLSIYREKYFEPATWDRNNPHIVYKWRLKPGAKEVIYAKIEDVCVSMKAKDWLLMPEQVCNVIKVPLPESARKLYKQLEKDLLISYADGNVVANTAAVLSNKLIQMASGALYDESKNVRNLHDAKLNTLEDVIESANKNPVLVFYWFKHDLDRLRKRFPKARSLDTTEDIEQWNKGEIDLLLVHPASAGHGLNLQAGGHIIVWFSLTWSLELYEQANARLYRQGQKKSVIVHHLVAEGTIDEIVMKALNQKSLGQDALMEAVKARIEEIRQIELMSGRRAVDGKTVSK
ncbi:DNA helicase, phage-associated [Sporomusa ovata]|uniref:DNA helicase, phage-associated n=2 Tax=Sporomusa ovata TaxID=2378 RepID=A0A0U1L5W2_9FIRM|nr:DNA helicase, phage-associated [Sporomusa ovata]